MNTDHYFKAGIDLLVDDKLGRLTEETGMEGFGIYFALLLELRMRTGYRCRTERIKTMAKRMEVKEEILWKVIEKYGLFNLEEENGEAYFSSYYLNEKMVELDRKKEALSAAGKKGAKARFRAPSKPGLSRACIREDKNKNIFSPLPSPVESERVREKASQEACGKNKIYRHEHIDPQTGERTYCGIHIPAEAPPRPSENAVLLNGQWTV